MAEASYVRVAPHNATGPIGTAAAVQLDACIPNFLIQEYFVTQASWIDEVVQGAPRAVRGEIAVPDRPGLGVELDEAAALAHPFKEAWGGQTLFSAGWQAGLRGGRRRRGGRALRAARRPRAGGGGARRGAAARGHGGGLGPRVRGQRARPLLHAAGRGAGDGAPGRGAHH